MEEPPLNPAHPTSVGALLAEEWTIDPYSTLPSFVEMVMMEDASRSGWKAIGTAVDVIEQYLLSNNSNRNSRFQNNNLVTVMEPGGASSNEHELTTRQQQRHRRLRRRVFLYVQHLLGTLQKWRSVCAHAAVRVLRQYQPEIQLLIVYLLERRSLQANDATVAESLYGGKRVKLVGTSSNTTSSGRRSLVALSQADKTRVALLAALVPYVRARLDRIIKEQNDSVATTAGSTIATTFRHFCLSTLYPLLRSTLSTWNFLTRWRYLMGTSVHYDLSSLFLQQIVRRVTQGDLSTSSSLPTSSSSSAASASDSPGMSLQKPPATTMTDANAGSSSLASHSILYYFITGSLAISWLTQIRNEWNTYRRDVLQQQQQQQQHSAQEGPDIHGQQGISSVHMTMMVIPPPPPACPLSNNNDDRLSVDHHHHLCPLCKKPRSKPTACASGYVFCLSCVLPHVQKHGKCPVTGMPCTETTLIRLYEPHGERGTRGGSGGHTNRRHQGEGSSNNNTTR